MIIKGEKKQVFNIGLYSSNPQSGKSETAKYLVSKYDYGMLTFAQPMKDMISILLRNLRYDENTIRRMLYGDLKEEAIPELSTETKKITPRILLVSLGSEWGRAMINDDMWVTIASNSLSPNLKYVCEDVRLFNEAEQLRRKDFKIIRVVNSRVPKVESISEGKLDGYSFDHIINNEGTIQDLHKEIDNMIRDWRI